MATTDPMARFSPELRFVIDAISLDPARVPTHAPEGLDWRRVQRLIQLHRLVPRIAPWLGRLEGVPERARTDLRHLESVTAARALRLAGELARIGKLLESAGIPYRGLKGPVLAQELYGSVGARQYTDLDILVPREHAWQAMRLIEFEGFKPLIRVPFGYEKRFLKAAIENRHIHPDGRVVEIHWKMLSPAWGHDPLTSHAWEGSATTTVAARAIPTPPWDVQTRFLILHGHKHYWKRLQWLLDVAQATQKDPLLARALNASAGDWQRVHDCTWLTLDTLFGTRLATDKSVSPAVRGLRDTILMALGREREEEIPSRQVHRFLRQSLDHRAQRIRYVWAIMRPSPAEWALIRLPKPLYFLYYVIRPTRLALRGIHRRKGRPTHHEH